MGEKAKRVKLDYDAICDELDIQGNQKHGCPQRLEEVSHIFPIFQELDLEQQYRRTWKH